MLRSMLVGIQERLRLASDVAEQSEWGPEDLFPIINALNDVDGLAAALREILDEQMEEAEERGEVEIEEDPDAWYDNEEQIYPGGYEPPPVVPMREPEPFARQVRRVIQEAEKAREGR